MRISEALQIIRTETGYVDAKIAKLIGVSSAAVSRWGMDKTTPTERHLWRLREQFRYFLEDEGWADLFGELRGLKIADSGYRSSLTHQYPSAYEGPVYTEVEPMPTYRKKPHNFTLQWVNPSHPSGGVQISGTLHFDEQQRIALGYAKWNKGEGFPVYLHINPPCHITFGQGKPNCQHVFDLNKKPWSPIHPDDGSKATIVLTLPFPKTFSERFPFKVGDVLYIIVGEEETDLPIKITMEGHSLVFDLSQLFP